MGKRYQRQDRNVRLVSVIFRFVILCSKSSQLLLNRFPNSGRQLVGAPGFEPGTSCAQGRRATRLRYAPTRSAYRLYGTVNVNASPQFNATILEQSQMVWVLGLQGCYESFHLRQMFQVL